MPRASRANKTGQTRNFLPRIEQRKLEDLLLEHKQEIEDRKWTIVAFAKKATTHLGLLVTTKNVEGAARTVEVKFGGLGRPTNIQTNRELNVRLGIITEQILAVLNELDMKRTPEFDRLLVAISRNEPLGEEDAEAEEDNASVDDAA